MESTLSTQNPPALALPIGADSPRRPTVRSSAEVIVDEAHHALADYQPAFGWEMAPPSESQVTALEKSGIFPGDIESAGKASLLLDRLTKRRDAGLATPKQIRMLERKGFQHVGQWTLSAASEMITRIAASSRRSPAGVDPRTYQPKENSSDT